MVEFRFPDIGEGVTEGVLLKWLVEPGDKVQEGDSLCEVETDKVTTELPSPVGGLVESCHGDVGETVYVGNVLVTIRTEEKDDQGQDIKSSGDPASDESSRQTENEEQDQEIMKQDADNDEDNAGVVGALEVSEQVMESSREGSQPEVETSRPSKVLATPVARRMAHELGIDLREVKGTGPVGRVMKADLEQHQSTVREKSGSTAALDGGGEPESTERISLSTLRKTIMKKMVISASSIPHATAMEEIDVSELVAYREKVKGLFVEEYGAKLTYLPFIIKALTGTLREHPRFNSRLDEEKQELILIKAYHIGIAVDTQEGLMVPVIHHADQKSILQLQQEADALVRSARERSLKLEQVKGSTFSITNYGSLGTGFGIPIINHPEAAILGIGQIIQKPVAKDGKVIIRWMMPLTLAFDHRIVDGGDAGRFMRDFIRNLVSPDDLLLR